MKYSFAFRKSDLWTLNNSFALLEKGTHVFKYGGINSEQAQNILNQQS